MSEAMDAVEIEIRWQRLISLLAEAALTIVQTSFSKIVSEGGDFACILYDPQGRMIAQDAGVSSKLGISSRTAALVLEKYPEADLRPGDVLITNDPWLVCGHLYDISVVKPLYAHGVLIGFAECLAHVPDIGGSLTNDSRDVYEEGLSIPVVRLVNAGYDNREVWNLIRSNVRVPDQIEGDIRAFVAALNLTETKVVSFLAQYRMRDLQSLADEIVRRSEEAMRNSIRKNIPPGVYTNRITTEGLDPLHELTIEVAIKVDEDSIEVDYAGTSPQSEHGINCTEVYAYAWTVYAVRCFTTSSIPYNQGLFNPIRMRAPLGSLLNTRHPAPVRMKSSTGHFIPFAIFGAMAGVIPDRIIAESGSKCLLRCFATSADGRGMAETYQMMGGLGARSGKDGLACMPFPSAGAETPIEVIEHALPITVLRKELVVDSGGAGRFRGGPGQRLRIRAETPMKILVQNIRVHTAPAGYAGGKPGVAGSNYLNGKRLAGKATVSMKAGDILEVRIAGGGGMFDPRDRPLEKVLLDVQEGFVSSAAAKSHYDVKIASGGVAKKAGSIRATRKNGKMAVNV